MRNQKSIARVRHFFIRHKNVIREKVSKKNAEVAPRCGATATIESKKNYSATLIPTTYLNTISATTANQ